MPSKVVVDGREYLQEDALACAECGIPLVLGKDEYGVRYLKSEECGRRPCAGALGAHPSGLPVGFPADLVTRRERVAAHEEFDRIWKAGVRSRAGAYAWMASRLGLGSGEAHVGRFDAESCRRLRAAVREDFPELFPFSLDP